MPSEVEKIKDESRGLRGTIAQTLQNDSPHFSHDEYQLLKFHGTYQQDDRDKRAEAKKLGQEKMWMFMVRTKTPGGLMTGKQYLDMDKIADDLGNATLRITTRQGIQFHGIVKKDLRDCIARINQSGITTWGACGDVVRNTLAPSSPIAKSVYVETQKLAKEISDVFLPKSRAYTEIWVNGEKMGQDVVDEEPIYGKLFLPRKFKIAIAIPPRNDVDAYSNDIGFIVHAPNGQLEGYTVVVGGGFGMTHGMQKTYPVLAKPLGYVKKENAVEVAIAILMTQRDYGNRDDRKLSRLKYLIESRGIDWMISEVQSRMKSKLEPAKPVHFETISDMLGWNEQGDGKLFLGVWVPEGRIQDTDKIKARTAFHKIVEKTGCEVRLTANCNIIFANIDPSHRKAIDEILVQHNIPVAEQLTEARKIGHACVALPTCGLSLAESERAFGGVMDEIDQILRELKLEKESILIRMSGCPNGCSRPYNADIAFVGRAPDKYAMYVGGSHLGDRLAGLEHKTVERKDIAARVRTCLEDFAKNRKAGESFTQFWGRTRKIGPRPTPEQFHVELAARATKLGFGQMPPAGE